MDKCSVKVSGVGQWGAFNQHKCEKPAVVEHGGKWYCRIHDPEYIKGKDAEREAKRKAIECPKCRSIPRNWWKYCPLCGTKYPNSKEGGSDANST